MSRTVHQEWIGKTDDTPVPPHVRLRVFERFKGVCCECGIKIRGRRWICDHRIALINGGENRERNLGPIHEVCDRTVKTPRDVAEKSINNRVRMKHLGITKRNGRPMPGTRASGLKKRMDGTVERR
ncbi:HNH endonuclease [Bradyrhizobium sp. BRP22]|uniref:HNH endonuclease n=1 Tax=Bradyrhizobium sp. BRP22 TaxID=2793821 RepID=UPI001CD50868|nr:HNH endonuclease [Bradyrhizobium sp. BRP22]MCA1452882.1 HNH endonuclease [Bradyrhizobium sp. BRP22]